LNKVLLAVLVTVSFSVLLGSQEAFAELKTWDMGAVTQNWLDGDNWSPNGVPSSSDEIVIPATFDVIMNTDFTISSGSITIEVDGLLEVPKDKTLTNTNGMITNKGFFFVDGKVVNTFGDTIENKAGALWGVQGDGSANNGVVINDGTINDSGEIESKNAKWTNSGTFNKNNGIAKFTEDSLFTNTDGGSLNVIGGGTPATSPTVIFEESNLINTINGEITIGGLADVFFTANSDLINKIGAMVNVNDKGLLSFDSFSELTNTSDLNINAGGIVAAGGLAGIENKKGGIINNQGASGNPARIVLDDAGSLSNIGNVNNKADGVILVRAGGTIENIKPGFIDNQPGATIIIEKSGNLIGKISGTGGFLNNSDNSITNFGIIDISGPWQNFGKIENNGIINILCGGSLDPLGTITGTGEFNEFECPVGGTLIPIGKTSLLLAYGELNSWWMAPIVIGIGVGVYLVKRRF